MRLFRNAILAVSFATIALLTAMGPVKPPLKVRFQLADGVRVAGELSSWDFDGFDGTFGRRLWTQIKFDDVWALHQRVMDQNAAAHWVNLGRVLLLISPDEKKAGDLAEQAFRRALRLDASSAVAIKQARLEAEEARRKRVQTAKTIQAAQLSIVSPEGQDWPATLWPALTADEQKAAVLVMRSDAEQVLQTAGLALVPVETDHVLLYTDAPRADSARWIMQLEKVPGAVERFFAPPPPPAGSTTPAPTDAPAVWGKIVVLVFQEQDRFQLVEAQSFHHLVPKATVAVCHPIGPKTFVIVHTSGDKDEFQWSMIHETVHAVMHRVRTPKRPPAWANEGMAEYMTAQALKDSPVGKARRKQGLEFIRTNSIDSVDAVLNFSYADQTWPGPKAIGLCVGRLLVELMIEDQPRRFAEWLADVKAGKDWQDALQKQFGVNRAKLLETFVQYYKVND